MSCFFMVVNMVWRSKRFENSNQASIKHNIDFLLDNFMEAEAKTILLPLYVAQWLTFAPKYSIRYDLITSNSHKFNVFVCLCSLGIVSLWLCSVFDHVGQFRGISAASSYVFIISLIVTMIFNSTITISKSNMNAYLIVLIRRIQKKFKFVHLKRGISVVNWVYVIGIVAFNLIHSTIRVLEAPDAVIRIFFTHLIYLSTDCNVIIAIRMIHWLGKLMKTWISELECFCLTLSLENDETDNNRIKNCRTKDVIISAYDELIGALEICTQIFRVPIFLAVVISFFQAIFNVQYLISLKSWQITMFVSQILWMKNIILIILLSMECEKVLLELKNAQVTCLVLSSTEGTDLSCLLRRQRHQVEVCCEGGPLPLDAAVPLQFLSVVATYTIAILQFHFL